MLLVLNQTVTEPEPFVNGSNASFARILKLDSERVEGTAMDIVWEEPPTTPAPRSNATWAHALNALRDRPNEWARIAQVPKRKAQAVRFNIANGKYSGVAEGEFEVRIAPIPDAKPPDDHGVWCRYVGEKPG